MVVAPRERVPLREGQRRWAELLRRIYEVYPLVCPQCAGPMRIVAFITERAVIERILAHLATRATRPSAPGERPGERRDARAPPSATRPTRRSARLRRTPPADAAELV